MSSSRRYSTNEPSGYATPSYRDDEHPVYSASLERREPDQRDYVGRNSGRMEVGEDELVEQCMNHAHDVASAHGAADVMPEHVVHAMARVQDAAAILDDDGYNVERLRRESAAVIAGEIPVARESNSTDLRASSDLAKLMHAAASTASRSGRALISLRDILLAFQQTERNTRAGELLAKWSGSAPRMQPQPAPRPRDEVRTEMVQYYNGRRDSNDAEHLVRRGLRSLEEAFSSRPAAAPVAQVDMRPIEASLRSIEQTINANRSELMDISNTLGERVKSVEYGINNMDQSLGRSVTNDLTAELQNMHAHLQEQDDRLHEIVSGLANPSQTADPNIRAEVLELQQTMDKRDRELLELQKGLEERVQNIGDVMRTQHEQLMAPQETLRQEIRGLRELLGTSDAGGNIDTFVSSLGEHSRGSEDRYNRMVSSFNNGHQETRNMILANNDRLADLNLMVEELYKNKGTATGATTDTSTIEKELSGIRALLTRLVNAQNANTEALSELRLDHSGDLSVVSNRLGALEKSMSGVKAAAGSMPVNGYTGRSNGEAGPAPTNGNGGYGYSGAERRFDIDFEQDLNPDTAAIDRFTGRTGLAGSGYDVHRGYNETADMSWLERLDRWLERRFS